VYKIYCGRPEICGGGDKARIQSGRYACKIINLTVSEKNIFYRRAVIARSFMPVLLKSEIYQISPTRQAGRGKGNVQSKCEHRQTNI
jgi:hypothetical protein